jgi:hypothetical protein
MAWPVANAATLAPGVDRHIDDDAPHKPELPISLRRRTRDGFGYGTSPNPTNVTTMDSTAKMSARKMIHFRLRRSTVRAAAVGGGGTDWTVTGLVSGDLGLSADLVEVEKLGKTPMPPPGDGAQRIGHGRWEGNEPGSGKAKARPGRAAPITRWSGARRKDPRSSARHIPRLRDISEQMCKASQTLATVPPFARERAVTSDTKVWRARAGISTHARNLGAGRARAQVDCACREGGRTGRGRRVGSGAEPGLILWSGGAIHNRICEPARRCGAVLGRANGVLRQAVRSGRWMRPGEEGGFPCRRWKARTS